VLPGSDAVKQEAQALSAQLDDYLLPRVAYLDAPLLVVVGGATGVGKSTLVNSLVRAAVSPTGVLRPTTRTPVLVCHPADAQWFGDTQLFPELERAFEEPAQTESLQVVAAPSLTPGLAFLDAPDLDSVVEDSRRLANRLIAAADLWLFVTTAARYADAVPWEALIAARDRGTVLAVVLDRVPESALRVVVPHLGQMLSEHGLGEVPLFVLRESPLDDQGLLLDSEIGPMREWFTRLAADPEWHVALGRRALDSVLRALPARVHLLAEHADAEQNAVEMLEAAVDAAYADAMDMVDSGLRDGVVLAGEALTEWREFVRGGELARSLRARRGRFRDQLRATVTGRSLPGQRLMAALESGVAALVLAAAVQGAEQASARWRAYPAGQALLEDAAAADPPVDLSQPSPGLANEITSAIRYWREGIQESVRQAAEATSTRLTTHSLQATTVLVMVIALVSGSSQLEDQELEVGETRLSLEQLLTAVFKDEELQRLAIQAREDLLERVRGMLAAQRRRYSVAVEATGVDPLSGERLRHAAAAVELARVEVELVPRTERPRGAINTSTEDGGASEAALEPSGPEASGVESVAIPEAAPDQPGFDTTPADEALFDEALFDEPATGEGIPSASEAPTGEEAPPGPEESYWPEEPFTAAEDDSVAAHPVEEPVGIAGSGVEDGRKNTPIGGLAAESGAGPITWRGDGYAPETAWSAEASSNGDSYGRSSGEQADIRKDVGVNTEVWEKP